MSKFPDSIRRFVAQQKTKPINDLLKDPEFESPCIKPGALPGYLLVKPRSDSNDFVRRCMELGCDVRPV